MNICLFFMSQFTSLNFCQFHCFFVNLWYNVRKGLVKGKKKENSYEPAQFNFINRPL